MRHLFTCSLMLALAMSGAAFAATKTITDVQAKLVIIHSFLGQYAAWPGTYALDERTDVTLCSIGRDEVTQVLPMMENASTSRLRVHVRRSVAPEQFNQCHILYLAQSRQAEMPVLLQRASRYPLLTVSSIPQFVEQGGMVGLESEVKYQGTFEKHYVRYSLNLKATQAVGINIHPDALELARKVVRP